MGICGWSLVVWRFSAEADVEAMILLCQQWGINLLHNDIATQTTDTEWLYEMSNCCR